MTILQDILAAANWNLRVTENFRTVSPAGLYGINPATTTGLTLGYLGGEFNGVTVSNGTVVLTASNTNYVVAHRTTGAVTVATTTTNWLDTGTYLQLYQFVAGTSTFTIAATSDKRQAFGGAGSVTGGTLTAALNEAPTVTIASGSTVNIGAAAANSISITGTTTITAFDAIASGALRRLVFAGALTLTHNGTALILPGASSITTAAGDVAEFLSLGSGNWRCLNYMRSSGLSVTLGTVNVFTKNQSVTPITNSSATGTVTPDASTSNSFQYTLTGNVTIANPTNLTSGMVLNFCLDQDATGGRTIAFGSNFKWPGGTVPTWITTASAKNFFSAYYDGTILRCSGAGGFA
jgi:hypothetical protein